MAIKIIVLSGGCCTGKSSLAQMLLTQYPDTFFLVQSLTTRPQHPRDLPEEYMYSHSKFLEVANSRGELLWKVADSDGTYEYATSKANVIDAIGRAGKIGIMILTPDIIHHLITYLHEKTGGCMEAIFFYLEYPGTAEISRRFKSRGLPVAMSAIITKEKALRAQAQLSGHFSFINNRGSLQETMQTLIKYLTQG